MLTNSISTHKFAFFLVQRPFFFPFSARGVYRCDEFLNVPAGDNRLSIYSSLIFHHKRSQFDSTVHIMYFSVKKYINFCHKTTFTDK